jgi:hypothetical protein
MRCTVKRQIKEIRERFARTVFVDLSDAEQTAQRRCHLKID